MLSLTMCFDVKDKDTIVKALKSLEEDDIFGAWYIPPKVKIADESPIEEDIDVQVSINNPISIKDSTALHDAADIAQAYILGFIAGSKTGSKTGSNKE